MDRSERRAIVERIYASLTERGHRPVDRLIGYILTGDPTYITDHHGARQLAAGVDRHDLLRDMLQAYSIADETAERSA